MCYNAAWHWKLGWYRDRHESIAVNEYWDGRLYDIDSYNRIQDTTIIVQVADQFTVSYNRKRGINAGTQDGGNLVLVHRQTIPQGTQRQRWSQLLAKLTNGQTY